MQQMIKSLIQNDFSVLAKDLYDFVERKGILPTEESIMNILKESNDFDEIGHKLNLLFVELTKEALLTAFSEKYRDLMRKKLLVAHDERSNANEDEIRIVFINRVLDYADTTVLEDFYFALKKYENNFLKHNLSLQRTFTMYGVSQSLIDQLLMLEGIDTFLYQTTVEPSDSREEDLYILHVELMKQQYELKKLSLDTLNDVFSVLGNLNSNLNPDIAFNPIVADFVVMAVKNT